MHTITEFVTKMDGFMRPNNSALSSKLVFVDKSAPLFESGLSLLRTGPYSPVATILIEFGIFVARSKIASSVPTVPPRIDPLNRFTMKIAQNPHFFILRLGIGAAHY